MDSLLQIVGIPVITAIVYGVAELYKYAVNGKESLIRLIPLLGAILGVILSIVAFYAAPNLVAGDNLLTAILVGGASGLAATGGHQIFKQLIEKSKADKTDNTKSEDNKDESQ